MKCSLPLPLGETLKVSSFESFKRMCDVKFSNASGNHLGRRGSNYDQCCVDCDTGKAIRGGALTFLPENVVLLDIGQRPDPHPFTSEDVYHENDRLPKISGKQLSQLTPHILRTLWKNPALKVGKKGTCPNCLRPDISQGCFGLCGACRHAANDKTGIDLLRALDKKSAELLVIGGGLIPNKKTEKQNADKHKDTGDSSCGTSGHVSKRSVAQHVDGKSSANSKKAHIEDQAPDGACQGQGSGSEDDVGGRKEEMTEHEEKPFGEKAMAALREVVESKFALRMKELLDEKQRQLDAIDIVIQLQSDHVHLMQQILDGKIDFELPAEV